ncbi:MAG: hypothetical protein JWQ18_3596 [Conexibacter sp.]|nr:hypothetical protein [Conexibacter sp.]
MHRHALAIALLATLAAALPAGAQAASKKPSLKVVGLSLNQWYLSRGAKVKRDDGTNGCYTIGGPSLTPQSLTLFGFVNAAHVPKSAPMTLTFTTPWDTAGRGGGPGANVYEGTFGEGLFKSKGRNQVSIFGGPQGPNDYFRFDMLPTGGGTSNFIDGSYGLKVSVTVKGKKLTSASTASVDCL